MSSAPEKLACKSTGNLPRAAGWLLGSFLISSILQAAPLATHPQEAPARQVLEVPDQYSTIQEALEAAQDGDTVRVAPGVYHGSLRIGGKSVQLVSWYESTGNPRFVRQTVLDGTIPGDPYAEDDDDRRQEQVILVEDDAGPKTAIVGFTIRDGDDGIRCHARIRIESNYFVNNEDAIDYEGGGGICQHNTFVANDDDAIDLDLDCQVHILDNTIRDNDDDGIEIRLHDYRGTPLEIVIVGNTITGNGEDGIQIIDYPGTSDRVIRIERNVIANNAMVGIGCMADANTRENYEGAGIPERIEILNNTIVENHFGITGGSNAYVANNIFVGQQVAALKRVAGESTITHNLLWENGAELVECTSDNGRILRADPQLDAQFVPRQTDCCVDAGQAYAGTGDSARLLATPVFRGAAPDLGAKEIE